MSDDRPDPLVPADVDISGLDGFILDVQKLFASELWALSTGDEFKAAVALWGRAWQQSPPGSLPKDERILAAFSGAGKDWRKVREMALHGFVECEDDRLYHRVLCQEVMNAHRKRQAFRDKTKAATEARRQRHEQRDESRDDQRDVVAEANVTSVKGKEKGKGNIESPSLRSGDARAGATPKSVYPPEAFERWWAGYPEKVGKGAAQKIFERIRKAGDVPFEALVCGVEAYRKAKPPDRAWCNPATWLNQQRWLDEPNGVSKQDAEAPRIDFGGGVSWPEPSVRSQVAHFHRDPSTWPADRLGPPPGKPGCRVPDRLLGEAA